MTSELETILAAFGEQIEELVNRRSEERVLAVRAALDGTPEVKRVRGGYPPGFRRTVVADARKNGRMAAGKKAGVSKWTVTNWMRSASSKSATKQKVKAPPSPMGPRRSNGQRIFTEAQRRAYIAQADKPGVFDAHVEKSEKLSSGQISRWREMYKLPKNKSRGKGGNTGQYSEDERMGFAKRVIDAEPKDRMALAKQFGISSVTMYDWIKRYKALAPPKA